ncbi:MAG: bifunctional serine/threonine-protein kinase/formylglycine-generating enzyme family protein [Acidobacteriota bacterium]
MSKPPETDQSLNNNAETLHMGSRQSERPLLTQPKTAPLTSSNKGINEAETMKLRQEDAPTLKAQPVTAGPEQKNILTPIRDGLLIGERFLGKYEIIEMIGSGGMGRVYKARHLDLGNLVAIKMLNTNLIQNDEAIERFKREARASAKVLHPNTVRVFDYGVEGNACFLVMEFLEGEPLRKRLSKRKRLPLPEIVHFVEQVCYVLEVMHRKGIVHRDLKPDNIFFHQQEDIEVVKVLDFGIAKVSSATIDSTLTRPGSLVGTPHYMSPEQCQGIELDGRADLYSFGVILYEMLAGRVPFDAENSLTLMFKHVQEEPQQLSVIVPHLPPALCETVMRLLAKEPKDRFQTAKDFLQAFCAAAQITPTIKLETLDKSQTGKTKDRFDGRTGEISSLHVPPTEVVEKPAPKPVLKYVVGSAITVLIATVALIMSGIFSPQPIQPKVITPDPPEQDEATKRISTLLKDFVLIEGGNYTIGREPNAAKQIPMEEGPGHQVILSSYYLSKYEVTNKEYREFVLAAQYRAPKGWNGNNYSIGADDLPVTNVSWDDAIAYCRWRSQRDKIDYRLPSEDEWEHAARGNDARLYPWGDIWDNSFAHTNKAENLAIIPLAVNSPPNNNNDRSPLGIFALAGNVSEWTASNFQVYPGSAYKPRNEDLKCKVYRGGNFNSPVDDSRTTARFWNKPDTVKPNLGFRLAVIPPKK